MVSLRVCLTLTLALVLLGNGAWTLADRSATSDSLASAGLTADYNSLHVESIEAGYKVNGHYFYNIFADVEIRSDDDNTPVNRAIVYSEWQFEQGPILEIQGKTDKSGHVVVGLRAGLHGNWNFCVVNVEKSGWDFGPDDSSVDLCGTVYVP
jgi:hypothetical protein